MAWHSEKMMIFYTCILLTWFHAQISQKILNGKSHIFWEGQKILHRKFDRYYIGQNFVAFSECMNFTDTDVEIKKSSKLDLKRFKTKHFKLKKIWNWASKVKFRSKDLLTFAISRQIIRKQFQTKMYYVPFFNKTSSHDIR